ncbi:MAG: hypothetical protein HN715_01350 [Rhodobiaceae bacterium]|jgi:hypothetical protein|nr:hypothetical protein [Rhodobiaceae bacterium]
MSDASKTFAPTHNSKALHQGLIVLGLILFGAYLLYDRGLLSVLLAGDKSRLSWLILLIWALMSARWIYLLQWVQSQRDAIETFQREPEDEQEAKMARWLNHGWFAADSVLKIGLLGTIIGFILMLAPISTLVSFDPASLQKALGGMSGGMAVALYTTLTGLSVNIVLRFQFQFLADTMQSLMLEARSPSAKADA